MGSNDARGFYEPGGVSVLGNTLYIADANHPRIVKVDLAGESTSVLTINC